MKNKRLIYILLSCIVFGIVFLTLAISKNASLYMQITSDGFKFEQENNIKMKTQSILQEVISLDIELSHSDVSILKGDEFSVTYNELGVDVKQEDGILYIQDIEEVREEIVYVNMCFTSKNNKSKVEITVPDDKYIDNILVNIKSGNIDISNQDVKKLEMKNSYGDITIDDAVVKSINFTQKNGNLEASNIKSDELIVVNQYGNFTISDCVAIDFKADIKNGDITCKNTISNEYEILNSYGDINLGVLRNLNKYSIDVQVDYGKFILNEMENSTPFILENGADKIKINAKNGDVILNFVD